jgi:hypothetical protein
MEQRTWSQTKARSDGTARFAQPESDPGVACVERGIGAARAIPAFPEANGPVGFIERVRLVDVLAQPRKSSGRKINRHDRKFRVCQPRSERAESVGEQYRPFRAGQGPERDPAGERFSIAIVIAPADLEIFETGVIALGRPDSPRYVRSLHSQAGVERAVIDHVNGPDGFACPGRIERFDRSGTGAGAEEDGDGETGRENGAGIAIKPALHPDSSPEALRFQRSGCGRRGEPALSGVERVESFRLWAIPRRDGLNVVG